MAAATLVSVIVPVLDESRALPALLDHLAGLRGRFEVLLADGGSRDGSVEVARSHPLVSRVLTATPGRGAQLNAAAAVSRGDVLLFLHADSRLPASAYESVVGALGDRSVVGGNFALRFDARDRFSRVLEVIARLQRRLGVYYGDSAIFVRAQIFQELGGFGDLPIMDDYDFARRLERRGRTVCLGAPVVTSARRWQRVGAGRTLASWILIQALYLARVPPARLARLYRGVR